MQHFLKTPLEDPLQHLHLAAAPADSPFTPEHSPASPLGRLWAAISCGDLWNKFSLVWLSSLLFHCIVNIYIFHIYIWSEMKVIQSHPTLCDPMDYTAHGILQARILEWVAFPFSRGSSQPRDQTQVSSIAGRFFTCWATSEVHI